MDNIKVRFENNGVREYPFGTSLYDISRDYQGKYEIIGAKVNNVLTSLNTRIVTDSAVKFIDYCDFTGYKMYKAGLEFLFETAIKDLYSASDVTFEHSVPKGVLAEIISEKSFNNEDIIKIKEKMATLVNDDIIFEKYNVVKKEAIDYFEKNNQFEKAANIRYTNEEIITLYKLKNNFNYFYTEMPYSTKAISQYDIIYLGKNRLVLLFPSSRSNGQVPEYVHYDNIIKSFIEGKSWLETMGVPYLSDLNEMVSNSKVGDLIEANELLFNQTIAKAAEEIAAKSEKKIILIAGPSSSGKTTTMKRIAAYLKVKGLNPIQISVDDYFVDREKTPKDNQGKYDFECLLSIDLPKFNQDLTDLLNGKKIELPKYDFISGKRRYNNNFVQMKEKSIILIEGLHALNDDLIPTINEMYKYKIYLSPFIPLNIDRHNYISTIDLRLLRRIIRDNRYRNLTVSETIETWQDVRDGEEKNIFPYIHQADIIINTALVYELGVVRVYAEPLLYSVKMISPYYEEARRLLAFLNKFFPIPTEYIGKNSILREFIGFID